MHRNDPEWYSCIPPIPIEVLICEIDKPCVPRRGATVLGALVARGGATHCEYYE